ncbi:nitrous oxide reductase accessory protein NosL [Reichenbachiella ulvae]|uniref:Nitrous oxide reductase accessory protein NosL n=1 Tax=Reichenbachiella ulvae TaxID=2980104 RepID=A0ABT3CWF1_9BACT|nr:nitrous oxide reductase accessory protein NosL [Reichenbachiella ulvae]MCV9387878.1 nitrous oxide reductase accessory protein NosL [Reichenbachiella ulvae]
MKKIYLLLISLLAFTLVMAQEIKTNHDTCKHCNMLIKEQSFAAVAILPDGEQLQFDAIECLINYLKPKREEDYSQLLVADYSQSGQWIESQNATYLKSKAIPSPMGAYLSAYPDSKTASRVHKEKGGKTYSWTELKQLFEGSNFGAIHHPEHNHDRSDAYASIGIMGDHVHHQGGWMLSLRYMNMAMDGNQSGADPISNDDIYQQYMAAPQHMRMEMYMLGIMYAPTNRLTLGLMQSFVLQSMDMNMPQQMEMGGQTHHTTMAYQTQSRGLGDLNISALYSALSHERNSFHLNLGLNLPQGSIQQNDDTPMSKEMKLPYAMQLGSGTIDISLGSTYKRTFEKSSWGVQPLLLFRTGQNKEGYRLGHLYQINTWYGYGATPWLAVLARAQFALQQGIQGQDEDLNPMMAPAANPINYGYQQVMTYIGTNLSFPKSDFWKNVKLGLEIGMPVYRHVEGIQMQAGLSGQAGLRYLL